MEKKKKRSQKEKVRFVRQDENIHSLVVVRGFIICVVVVLSFTESRDSVHYFVHAGSETRTN